MCFNITLKQEEIDFIHTHFKKQIKALELFFPINKKIYPKNLPHIVFGGGTALSMYYFHHRLSFDVDLFLENHQCFAYFSPKLWLNEINSSFDEKYIEQHNYIRLNINDIKIEILCSSNFKNPMLDESKTIFSQNIYIHSIEDIIAHKVVFRKKDNKTRDIFDIAVALEKNPKIFDSLLDENIIQIEDLRDLKGSLKGVDINKYKEEISIIEPFKEFKEISLNAVNIILSHLEKHK